MDKTWFFIPGSKEKYLAKAEDLGADVLIFDLEDSVVPNEKAKAREMIKKTLSEVSIEAKKFVRVNEINSLYFPDDIKALISKHIDGIVIPKVNSADDMKIADYLISYYEKLYDLGFGKIKIVPLIETGKGIVNVADIATSTHRLETIAFGAEDYMLDVNIPADENNALLHIRSVLVEVSGAANINPPVDSVYTDFNNSEGLIEASKLSRGMGFQGRLVIHPKQIDDVNNVYAPTEAEVEEAKKIVEAYNLSFKEGSGAIEVDGKMIDIPVAERAKNLLKM